MRWDRLLQVADAIEQSPNGVGFNMCAFYAKVTDNWLLEDALGRGCSTIACVGGHAAILSGEPLDGIEFKGAMWLELNADERRELFTGVSDEGIINLSELNGHGKLVPEALRWMAKNNTISWTEAFKQMGIELKVSPI